MCTSTEKCLAEELRNLCENGKEKNPTQSAKILHKLGLLYQQRCPDLISLIQSAALFNAAISRKPENVKEIQSDLKSLCIQILHAAGVSNKEVDLVEEAKHIKTSVEKMRQRTDQSLLNVKQIPEGIEKEQLIELETEKIKIIKEIQDGITSDYKLIMKYVSDLCVLVMGHPPCKFAQAGMGSMARNEITPYSDYENIIVLENGCQTRAGYYERTLPYFRWYAVIFQVILINLEETILPSVNIASLNDTTVQGGDWFFDAYTTRGVSFDGMMPHACKSPLGRQNWTKKKPWSTELIKPIDEMLQYLDADEDLRNGYQLSDILTKTCFVYGEKVIYDVFYDGVQKKLKFYGKSIVQTQIIEQIKKDLSSFGTKVSLSPSANDEKYNFKQIVYRSTTLFVSALGRLYGIEANSCFNIIDKLTERDKITTEASHKLKYAVAIACEIRLKVYMDKKGQNDWIGKKSDSLLKAVGQASCINYFQIAYSLQCDTCCKLNIKKSHFYSDLLLLNISICDFLGLTAKTNKLLRLCAESMSLDTQFHDFDSCLQGLEKSIKVAEKIFLKSTLNEDVEIPRIKVNHFLKISKCLLQAKKYNEATEFSKRCLNIIENNPKDTEIKHQKSLVLNCISDGLRGLCDFDEAIVYYEKCLELQKQFSNNIDTDKDIARTLNYLGICFTNAGQYDKAMSCLEISLKIKTNISVDENSDRDIAGAFNNIGISFYNAEKYKDSLCHLEKSLNVYQNIAAYDDVEKEIGLIYNNMGLCFFKTNVYEKAMLFFRKALTIKQRISSDKNNDRFVAGTLNNMGACFYEMYDYKKARRVFQKALNIYERTSLDKDTDSDLKETRSNIDLCLKQTKN